MTEYLDDVALFIAVARTGSFTQAAAATGLPVSSVSRRIARLEKLVGMRLFHRTTRRVGTTEAGQAYLNRCGGLVDEIHQAHKDLRKVATTPFGRLRVTVSPDFATYFLAPRLIAFRRAYPDVAIDLDLTTRRVDLSTESVDLALRFGPLEDSTLVARRIASLRIALFAAPFYLAKRGAPRTPADLQRHDCLSMETGASITTWTLTRGLNVTRVPVAGPFTANSMALLHRLALDGAGIVKLDAALVYDDVSRGRLVAVLPAWSVGAVPLHALMPSRLMPAKTRVFVDFLALHLAPLDTVGRKPLRRR